MNEIVIEFKHVSKYYDDGHAALNQISFQQSRGEMIFLTGHSGAGKSTLLKLITLMETCSSGQVWLNGQNLQELNRSQVPYIRRSLGMIFQQPHLLSDRTVFDNVALPLVINGYRHQDISRRVKAALDKVGLLNKEKVLPSALSSGEQQRVNIARAIVNKPLLLIADEPTGNLDPALAVEIMTLFEQFSQVGVSTLIASHDLTLITRLKHRILTLEHGSLIKEEHVTQNS